MNFQLDHSRIAREMSEEDRADLLAVSMSLDTGVTLDPAIRDRVRARSAAIRRAAFEKFGVQAIGVSAIRELRGELPE